MGETIPTRFYYRDPVVTAVAMYVDGCGAGRIYAAIQPNGRIVPCIFLSIVMGGVRLKSFHEILEESELFKKLRDRNNLKGYCKVCPCRFVCGGCRARALAYTGNPLGPDPGCIYNKSV